MNEHLENLKPEPLWRHFQTFCETPRPSWHEQALAEKIEAWADDRGLAHERDAAGNLLIRKPATPGAETAPGIVLQGHLDMVAETEAGIEHDFHADPIQTTIENGWLTARGTTLGADNGIGAAAALAVLEDDQLTHGPLEALLTVAEEVSLVGASRLAESWLQGDYLLNLDTEQGGDVTIGCAGGSVVSAEAKQTTVPLDADYSVVKISIDGLVGGHSGMDIHTGRANANQLLARALRNLRSHQPRLIDYSGGRMDNAITRAASATIAVPSASVSEVETAIATLETTLKQETVGVDAGLSLSATCGERTDSDAQALTAAASQQLIDLLAALPYGVDRMSTAAPGTVETSNNLGVIQLADGVFRAQLLVRSLVDSARDALVDRICAHFDLAGIHAEIEGGYPGWSPDPDAQLLTRFEGVHKTVTGHAPDRQVLHAGLECGLIGAKYSHLEMISFGPTIRGAHSPAECVELDSVETFYAVLQAGIADLARS